MRWTRAAPETRALSRTAKSCGSDAPIAGVKSAGNREMTVSNKRGHRGEREVSRKTIARGMPGETGVTVVTMLVCFFILHARLRVHRAPGIPCALNWAKASRTTRAHCAAGSRMLVCERRRCCLKIESATSSPRKRGPITTGIRGCTKVVGQRLSKQATRRMGPGVRRDDDDGGAND